MIEKVFMFIIGFNASKATRFKVLNYSIEAVQLLVISIIAIIYFLFYSVVTGPDNDDWFFGGGE